MSEDLFPGMEPTHPEWVEFRDNRGILIMEIPAADEGQPSVWIARFGGTAAEGSCEKEAIFQLSQKLNLKGYKTINWS